MLPAFVLGLCTAYAYERDKTLLAPMLVYAAYNATILGYLLLYQAKMPPYNRGQHVVSFRVVYQPGTRRRSRSIRDIVRRPIDNY